MTKAKFFTFNIFISAENFAVLFPFRLKIFNKSTPGEACTEEKYASASKLEENGKVL
jgi:hypothetical protein